MNQSSFFSLHFTPLTNRNSAEIKYGGGAAGDVEADPQITDGVGEDPGAAVKLVLKGKRHHQNRHTQVGDGERDLRELKKEKRN